MIRHQHVRLATTEARVARAALVDDTDAQPGEKAALREPAQILLTGAYVQRDLPAAGQAALPWICAVAQQCLVPIAAGKVCESGRANASGACARRRPSPTVKRGAPYHGTRRIGLQDPTGLYGIRVVSTH